MTTSLQQQLLKLAVPQTKALVDFRRTASILFDPKEAATKDRRTIYELGLSGLQQLIALNPTFLQFEVTLFEEATLHLERSVENWALNDLLDRNIRKFMQHLSPYFLLRPTHMCLEWLLRRFRIHDYNRDELIALALPYHGTNVFVKVLETIRFRQAELETGWGWLSPAQKAGVSVAKGTIIAHAGTNPIFFKFICNSTLQAVKELGMRAHLLQTQINFYATIIVGVFENTDVKEWHISSILPSLMYGLKSDTADFVAAAFIITGQIATRTTLKPKLCKALIERIANVRFERLQCAAVLLLLSLFDTQREIELASVSSALMKLMTQDWLLVKLAALIVENVAVQTLCKPLLQVAVTAIQANNGEADESKRFLKEFIDSLKFPTNVAQELIRCFLDCYTDPSDFEMDVDKNDGDMGFQEWYADFLHKFENQYPTAFDLTIKEALSLEPVQSSTRGEALKLALAYRLENFDKSMTNVYENLYHYMPKRRQYAAKVLVDNLGKYKAHSQNYQLLKECLVDRIIDENELVVSEVLKLPTSDFVEMLGYDTFLQTLFAILYKGPLSNGQSEHTLQLIIRHLTAPQIVANCDTNLILLSLMTFLFPTADKPGLENHITAILQSSLSKKLLFLNQLDPRRCKTENKFDLNKFKLHFLTVSTKSSAMPSVRELYKSILYAKQNWFKLAEQFTHFLVLVIACFKQEEFNSAETLELFNLMSNTCSDFEVKVFDKQRHHAVVRQTVPFELFSDFVVNLLRCSQLTDLSNWVRHSPDLKCFLVIFDYHTKKVFDQENVQNKHAWTQLLKSIMDKVFGTPQQKIDFLLNFYGSAQIDFIENFNVLRIRAFKVLEAILRNKNNDYTLSIKHVMGVLIALNSECEIIRMQALKTLEEMYASERLQGNHQWFVENILKRRNDFTIDQEQFPLILFLLLKSQQVSTAHVVLTDILKFLYTKNALDDAWLIADVLRALKHVDDEEVLYNLLPLALNALDCHTFDGAIRVLPEPYNSIYQRILDRFDVNTIANVLVDKPEASKLLEKIFHMHTVFQVTQDKFDPIPCALLESWDERVFSKMPTKFQAKFVHLVAKTLSDSKNGIISTTANKLLKKCTLDYELFIFVLEEMMKSSERPLSARKYFNGPAWKVGVAMLELLENKKKATNTEKLTPVLFKLLKFCLDSEEQSTVEYPKQLTLSLLLHCCKRCHASGKDLVEHLPKSTFRIDLIVQCMRDTPNPQTHHNALLLLSYCANLFPQQVLHNMVSIFTFVGSSVMRQEDPFNFHIIGVIIESVIPIIVRGSKGTKEASTNANKFVVPVLKIFSDIMLDVPEHRRLKLYVKLMQTLGADEYLWMYLCVVFEAHVLHEKSQDFPQKKKAVTRIEIVTELINTFPPSVIAQTCIHLLTYSKHLTNNMDNHTLKLNSADESEVSLFDPKTRTAKQLRHFKYVTLQFVASVTSSIDFLLKVAKLSEEELLNMKPYYQNWIVTILSYVPLVNAAIERDSAHEKFWNVLLHNLHDILKNAIGLLSTDMFLSVVIGLMQHQVLSVRRKVIEILITKLQNKDFSIDELEQQQLYRSLKPLCSVVDGIMHQTMADDATSSSELVAIQQNALIAIKLLSHHLALAHIEDFKAILDGLVDIVVQRGSISKILLAAVILTMIEISANLKVHSLAQLRKFMPVLLKVLKHEVQLPRTNLSDNVCIAVIIGLQKLFESVPLFLGRYLAKVLISMSVIAARDSGPPKTKDTLMAVIQQKIAKFLSTIANRIPPRILIPNCVEVYKSLMASGCYINVAMLMTLLSHALNQATVNELLALEVELGNFFILLLEFRFEAKKNGVADSHISCTEELLIDAFVIWVMKLSESSFRPLFHRTFEWALVHNSEKETTLTYCLLTSKLAQCLKGLFMLFAHDFVKEVPRLLEDCNSTKTTLNPEDEAINHELLKTILFILETIFLHYNKSVTLNFKNLAKPIVEQLENRLVLEYEDLQLVLQSCVAQLATTAASDTLCKDLNHQVLLKTRTDIPETRVHALNCCTAIARKLGEEFAALLPDTIPFIAELLEDEDPRVEKNTRRSVQELEQILGESLQKYF